MSKPATLLKELLLKQLDGKILFTTSINAQFQYEFCTDGLVLGPLGQILYLGELSKALQWAGDNLSGLDKSDAEADTFEMSLNLRNSESDPLGG